MAENDDIKFVKENSIASKPITKKDLEKPELVIGFMKNEKGSDYDPSQKEGNILTIKKRGDVYDFYRGDELRPSSAGIDADEVLRVLNNRTAGYTYLATSRKDPKLARWIDIDDEDIYTNRLRSDADPTRPLEFIGEERKPVASLSDKIKNKSLTVREAIDNAGVSLVTKGGEPTALAKNIEAAGMSLDAPWDDIKSNNFLIKLNEVGTEANFTSLLKVENRVKQAASVADVPYPYVTVFGAGSKSVDIQVDGKPLEKARQARRKGKPTAIPGAVDAVPALVRGLNAIPDEQTRAAVAFNILVPLRPIEVSNIGIDDIDFETGKFKEAWRRGNKIRNDIELPEVALELLRDARDTAIANGQDKIFDTTTEKLTKGTKVPGGIADQFKAFRSIMGRDFKGSSDIRKIVPSLMVGELQAGIEVSTIMGHATTDEMMGSLKKMTASSYISPIITSEGSAAKQALRGYHNMMSEVLQLTSLNELPATMGFSAKNLTSVGAPKLSVVPKNSDITPTPDKQTVGTLTDADLGLFEDIKAERSEKLQLSATKAKKERLELQAQMGDLDEQAIRAKVRREDELKRIRADERAKLAGPSIENPEPSSLEDLSPELQEKLNRGGFDISKFLGKTAKAIGIGAALETARQFIEEPVATAAELGKEVLLERGLGAGPGAAVSMIMQPTELASGELTPEDRAMAEVQRDTGFVNIDRGPEAAPINQDQGFLSR